MDAEQEKTVRDVRDQFLRGEIAAINVYWKLADLLSAAEIEQKLREWEQVRRLAQELDRGVGGLYGEN